MNIRSTPTDPPTIKTIARLAGVSRGTVDRVLNCRKGVKSETEERIREIARELNYKPNLAAKSLSVKGTGGFCAGIATNSIGNPFFDEVLAGVWAKASEILDYGINTEHERLAGYDVSEQLAAIDRLIKAGANGIILTPVNSPLIAERLKELNDSGFPVVCMGTDILNAPKACYVGANYIKCGSAAAGMFGLLSSGKRMKIGVVTGSLMLLGNSDRLNAFCGCLKTEFPHLELAGVKENNDDDELSYTKTTEILKDNNTLDGLFLCGAGIEGSLAAVRDMKLEKQPLIITIDLTKAVKDALLSGLVTATVCREPFKQGYEAMRVMFELLLAKKQPMQNILTETKIVIKHSL